MTQDRNIQWLTQDKYHGHPTPDIEKDIKRLRRGEPLDYIIGNKPFLNCHINLSFKPLIPRTETEYWTEKAIWEINKTNQKRISCLDIFAGSGCIGIAILKNCPQTHVSFGEIDQQVTKQIRLNLEINQIRPDRYRVITSNLFENISEKFDYIFANPPYINPKGWKDISISVRRYEPSLALLGGKGGTEIITAFLQEAKKYLNPEGIIYLEFGYGQEPIIRRVLEQNKYRYEICKDQYQKQRYVKAFLLPHATTAT